MTDRVVAQVREIRWPLYWLLTVIGSLYVASSLLGVTGIGGCDGPIVACDAAAYYYTDHGPYSWAEAPLGVPPFRYPPPFLWLIHPLKLFSFEGFVTIWTVLHVVGLLWLRAGWLLAVPGVNEDVIRGNINVFVAVLVVIAVRQSAAWAPVILTKITTVIGLAWPLARREWREALVAMLAIGGIVAIGVALQPELWAEWLRALISSPANYAGVGNLLPLIVRVPIGAAVVVFAARTERPWLVPVALLIAWPGILPPALMILAAVPRLRTHTSSQRV